MVDKGLLFRWPTENNDLLIICPSFKSQFPWLFVTTIIWLCVRVRVRIGENRNSYMGDKGLLFRQPMENNNMVMIHLGSNDNIYDYLWPCFYLSGWGLRLGKIETLMWVTRVCCLGNLWRIDHKFYIFKKTLPKFSRILSA